MALQVYPREDASKDFGQALAAFESERDSRGLSRRTLAWYRERLERFREWLEAEWPGIGPGAVIARLIAQPQEAVLEHTCARVSGKDAWGQLPPKPTENAISEPSANRRRFWNLLRSLAAQGLLVSRTVGRDCWAGVDKSNLSLL